MSTWDAVKHSGWSERERQKRLPDSPDFLSEGFIFRVRDKQTEVYAEGRHWSLVRWRPAELWVLTVTVSLGVSLGRHLGRCLPLCQNGKSYCQWATLKSHWFRKPFFSGKWEAVEGRWEAIQIPLALGEKKLVSKNISVLTTAQGGGWFQSRRFGIHNPVKGVWGSQSYWHIWYQLVKKLCRALLGVHSNHFSVSFIVLEAAQWLSRCILLLSSPCC